MKIRYYLGVLALGLMTSCLQEQFIAESVAPSAPDFEVEATTIDEPETRTQLSGKKVLWCAGDGISVLNDGSHYRYIVKDEYDGSETAKFKFDPSVGEIDGATSGDVSSDVFVAVYPYTPSTTFAKSENGYLISTEIPVNQTYAVDSYGANSSPMVAINELRPYFSFKNVGSLIKVPLVCAEGENVTIMTATLESKKHKIAGATEVIMENGVPTSVKVTSDGVSSVTITCGDGVTLDPATPTNFIFVLAPGTYEANDLTIKFTDSLGSYFETKIEEEKTLGRSQGTALDPKTFDVTGVDPVDLWVKALAGAYMEAERIVPTITSITKVYNWVVALKENPKAESLIQEAITLLSLGKYDLAYDVLGGIPGLERQYEHFDAVGSAIVKVDITGTAFFQSMLTELEYVKDAESLLAYLTKFEQRYEATGLQMDVNEAFYKFGDYLKNPEDFFNLLLGRDTEEEPEKTEEELLAEYKEGVATTLNNQITACTYAIKAIDAYKSMALWNKEKYDGEKASMESFVNKAQPIVDNIANLSREEIVAQVNDLPMIKIELSTLKKIIENLPGGDTISKYLVINFDPKAYIEGADSELGSALDAILNNGIIDGYIDAMIDEIVNYSLVDALEIAVNSDVEATIELSDFTSLLSLDGETRDNAWTTLKNKMTKVAVNTLFSNPDFLDYVIESLRELLTAYEESAIKEAIDKNQQARDLGIQTALYEAITYARESAIQRIDLDLDATNEKNLTSGPWGMFKKILYLEKCIQIFTDLGMLKVYTALTDLVAIIDDIITYNRTDVHYYKEYEDYVENEDWWVLTFVDNYEDVEL